jgi:hypothetical protein
MARNQFPGICYRCRERVEAGEGHFERFQGGWRTQHATCAIKFRGTVDPTRPSPEQIEKWRIAKDARLATQTGKAAQQARQRIRQRQEPLP